MKIIICSLKRIKKTEGFTLIELVIYMGILSILVSIMSSIFSSIVDVQLESTATSSVNQDGRYILGRLIYYFQANKVDIDNYNVLGIAEPEMHVKINGNPTADVYSVDSNRNLILTNSSGIIQLNSYDTSVSNFSATRLGSGGSSDTIRVSFTLTSKVKERSGYETKTFQSTYQEHN